MRKIDQQQIFKCGV